MSRKLRAWREWSYATWFALVVLAIAFLGPVFTSHAVNAVDPPNQLLSPSGEHWLGTDVLGRDFGARVAFALRTSIIIAVLASSLTVLIGTIVGTAAGLLRAWDNVLMRIVDAGLAFPRVFLLLALFAMVETVSVTTTILILGLTGWFRTSRLVRAETMAVGTMDYATASVAAGASRVRQVVRHVVPNVAPVLIVTWVLSTANFMLMESGLAFLGFGVERPTPSLGRMVMTGREYLAIAPRLSLIPGIAIGMTVVAFGLLGDRIQKTLDPRTS